MSDRHISDRFLDKAIDRLSAPAGLVPPPEPGTGSKIEETIIEKEAAIKNEQFEQRKPRDQEQRLQAELEIKRRMAEESQQAGSMVTPEDIATVVAN